MLNISIDEDKVTVTNTETCGHWTNETVNFFGLVYEKLEKQFPGFNPGEMGDMIAFHVLNGIQGNQEKNPHYMFHCREIGTSLYDLISFIDGRSTIEPTLKDIEEMRISNRMAANYLPVSFDDKDSMRFEGLKTVTQVMIATLYYYAYHDYKLVRCKHCGKWFATKSLKKQYCTRISPCFGVIINGKDPLKCEQAVRNIMQNCSRIKNRIETKAAVARRGGDNSYLYCFVEECDKFYMAAKQDPSVFNLQNYYYFLKETEKSKGWLKSSKEVKNHG